MMAKLGKLDNKLNSEREGSRPNINLHLAVPLSLGEEEGNGGSGVYVSNTTVKMMKQGNHISLRQGFNQAKKRGERVQRLRVQYLIICNCGDGTLVTLSHDKLTASRTR